MMRKKIFGTRRTPPLALALLVLLAALFAGACPSDAGDPDPVDPGAQTTADFTTMLKELGVNPRQTPATDPNGNQLPAGYNPLGAAGLNAPDTTLPGASASTRRARAVNDDDDDNEGTGGRTSLGVLYEIFLGGVDYDNTGRKSAVYQDFKGSVWPASSIASFTPLSTDPAGDAWLSAPKTAIGGDFDGDGYGEVLIAVVYREEGKIALRRGKGGAGSGFTTEAARFDYPGGKDALAKELPAKNGNSKSGANWDSETEFLGLDLAVGDIDADGSDEAILVVAGYVFLIDDADAGFAATQLRSYNVSDRPSDQWRFVSVACADYDQDGYDDWVEAVATASDTAANIQTATYTIYSGQTRAPFGIPGSTGDVKVASNNQLIRSVNVVTGDFDGDGLPETAFCGRRSDGAEYRLYILDTTMDADSKPVFKFLSTVTQIGWKGANTPQWGSLIPPLAAGDMNGDGVDEIFAVSAVFGVDASGEVDTLYTQKNPGNSDPGNNTMYNLAVMGDVNGDMKADVLYYDWAGRLTVVTVDDAGEFQYKNLTDVSYPRAADRERGMAIALANIDADSYILEYKGHAVIYTDPMIVAVVASTPYYGDITYPSPIDHHRTTYGKTTALEDGTRQSDGVQAVLTIGHVYRSTVDTFEPFPGILPQTNTVIDPRTVGFIEFSGGVTWGKSHAKEVTSTMSYSAGAGEDIVVFTSVPYDVYEYKVISAPAGNSDGGEGKAIEAGDIVSMDFPREAGTYTQSVSYYNAHNGDNPDVIVPHTVGKPFTYTSFDQMEKIKRDTGGQGLFTTETQMVTGRSNFSWTRQSVLSVESTEKDFEWNVGVKIFGGYIDMAGSVEASAGYKHTSMVNHRVSKGLFIEGEVPDVPVAAEDHPLFRWGLLMYPYTDDPVAPTQAYNYVTYWVEEAK